MNKSSLCIFCKEKIGIYKKVCCSSPFCSVACGKLTGCCDGPSKSNISVKSTEIEYPVKELTEREKWELDHNDKLVDMLKDKVMQRVFEKIAKSTITGNETSTLSQYVSDPEFMAIADEIVLSIEKANSKG